MEQKKEYNNILIIAGNGRNIGKTQLACEIISNFSKKTDIIALKISSHFHEFVDKSNIIGKKEGYIICEETSINTNKDSSRMLISGAKKSYYIQTTDNFLLEAFNTLINIIGTKNCIICESGNLANKITPGLFILLKDNKNKTKDTSLLENIADKILISQNNKAEFNISDFKYDDGKWFLSKINLTAAILAGGMATRFNGAEKGLININNQTIIERTYKILNSIFSEVFIISNNAEIYKNIVDCNIYPDIIPNLGPIGGLLTAMEKATTKAVFIAPNDMPYINKSMIIKEVDFFKNNNSDIIIPRLESKNEYLHAIYSTHLKTNILEYINAAKISNNKKDKRLSLYNLEKFFSTSFMEIPNTKFNKLIFSNINSVADLENLSLLD